MYKLIIRSPRELTIVACCLAISFCNKQTESGVKANNELLLLLLDATLVGS